MKQIEVVAAIIRKGDQIFATQRGYGEWKDWNLPNRRFSMLAFKRPLKRRCAARQRHGITPIRPFQ